MSSGTFTKGGRTWTYQSTEDQNSVLIYYNTNQTEYNRVLNKNYGTNINPIPGDQYAVEQNSKYFVLVSGYEKQSDGSWKYGVYPPGRETSNGNQEQVINIGTDLNLKKQLTGPTNNTSQINPNQPQSPGTSTSSPTSSTPNSPYYLNPRSESNTLIYPISLNEEQDYIRFEVRKLKKSPTAAAENLPSSLNSTASKQFGANADYNLYEKTEERVIILPIQASITDQNTVDWGSGQLNELQRMLGQTSLEAMMTNELGEFTKAFGKGFADIYNQIKGNNLIYAALLEQAIQAPGLTSRLTGGVLNPNMELLFQGPQLRPFNFTFKMSPRSAKESTNVKSIIKTFKKNMAPKVENMFLASPHVFKIEYCHGKSNNTHKSINLIKTCALQNCSVDYTPLGTYATFDDVQDREATMVSYTMSLSFTEINPIYYDDYLAEENHSIGF